MTDLPWFPYEIVEWETRVRELGLSIADEGALMRLCRGSWRAAEPCTIADRPDELARIVGHEWKKAVKVFREQFAPLAEEPTRRRCGWLYESYLRALEKHLSYQNRGGKGGRRKAELLAQLEAGLEAQPVAEQIAQPVGEVAAQPLPEVRSLSRESTTEALSCAPAEHTAKSPPTGDAPAPGGAALPAATTGDYLAKSGAREAVAMRGHRPPPDAHTGPVPTIHAVIGVRDRRTEAERVHREAMREAAAAWSEDHSAQFKTMTAEQRQRLGLPAELSQALRRVLAEALLTEIAKVNSWPSVDVWDGKPLYVAGTAQVAS